MYVLKLHLDGIPIYVNIEHIVSFSHNENGRTILSMTNAKEIIIDEKADWILSDYRPFIVFKDSSGRPIYSNYDNAR